MVRDATPDLDRIDRLCASASIAINFSPAGGYSLHAMDDIPPLAPIVVYPGSLMRSNQVTRAFEQTFFCYPI
jgi:hypothetical protein